MTTGAQSSSQRYYPFGQRRGGSTVATVYQYTGQLWQDNVKQIKRVGM